MSLLSESEIKDKLGSLDGWEYKNNTITKEYGMEDFTGAMGLVVKAGIRAEKMNHHPDIEVHSYNKVRFTITNHDEGGVSDKCFELAKQIENTK